MVFFVLLLYSCLSVCLFVCLFVCILFVFCLFCLLADFLVCLFIYLLNCNMSNNSYYNKLFSTFELST